MKVEKDDTVINQTGLFCVGNSDDSMSLLCSVISVDENIIHAFVENGHWEISFDLETGGNLETDNGFIKENFYHIRYVDFLPKGDYNVKLNYLHNLIEEGHRFPILTNIKFIPKLYELDNLDDIPF